MSAIAAANGFAYSIDFGCLCGNCICFVFIPRQFLVILTAIGVIWLSLVLANVMGTALPDWKMTTLEFSEWGNATVLALVASGLGLGLYWQSSIAQQ